ncbi:MAG: hypothetical protein JNK99_15720 [Candidatus Accumulibacter sp.]|uniref:hypothetical protein n=1 Tax=Accumulibacter sp. TaxID=2053492 RepID=UPI001A4453B4|nr:hypothetical protein [Accumulibacter sp.]MBL8396168.1 hypothetical protein [Accumulibacter sp.]
MDGYQIGWIVVLGLFGAALSYALLSNLLNKIGELYAASLHHAGIAAIRRYGADMQEQGYYFLPRRLAANNPKSETEKGQQHGLDV